MTETWSTKKVKGIKKSSSEDEMGVFSTTAVTRPVTRPVKSGPKRVWSSYQTAIFNACKTTSSSLIIEALAGSGKTTTAIEMIRHLTGKVLLCAFNKRIAEELQRKAEASDNLHISTLHGLGYRMILRQFPGTDVDKMRGLTLAQMALAQVGGPKSKNYAWMVKNTASIVKEVSPFVCLLPQDQWPHDEGAKQRVLEIGHSFGYFDQLDDRYAEVTAEATLLSMRLALDVKGSVDYSDMLFVPLHRIATRGEYDVVMVDEGQDMNAARLHLAQQSMHKDGRLIVVGDRHQAIYGFRGASSDSMERLKEKFKATILTLPVSYRCAHAIIKEAQAYVPEILAANNAPDGLVRYDGYKSMIALAKPGDFILSRVNAPLLRLCLMFVKAGRPAVVEGRDIGQGLVGLIQKMTFGRPTRTPEFLQALRVWEFKQIEKAQATDDLERAAQVKDQCDALRILSEDCDDVGAVKRHIDRMFDDTQGAVAKIVCSTVHKAKGLEADRVFILCDTFKGGWATDEAIPVGEEANLKYVAITRAKRELVYIDHPYALTPMPLTKEVP